MKRGILRQLPIIALIAAFGGAAAVLLFAADAESQSQRDIYPKDNFDFVEDGLSVGGMLSEPPKGTKVVLNVGELQDVYKADVHRWDEIPDFGPAPKVAWLQKQVKFIHEQRKDGRSVYVHCRAGVNRSVMVVAAYLMWRDKLTRDEALERIQKKRAVAGPLAVYRDYLAEYEKTLK